MFNVLNQLFQGRNQYGMQHHNRGHQRQHPVHHGRHQSYQPAPININIILQTIMGPLMQMFGGNQYGNSYANYAPQQHNYGGYGQQQHNYGGYGQQQYNYGGYGQQQHNYGGYGQQQHNYGGYGQQQHNYGGYGQQHHYQQPQVIYKDRPYPVHIPVPYNVPCEHEPVDYPTKTSLNLSGDPILRVNSMIGHDGENLTVPGLLSSGLDVVPPNNERINLLSDDSDYLNLDAIYHDINGDSDVGSADGTALRDALFTIDDYDISVEAKGDKDILLTLTDKDDPDNILFQTSIGDGEKEFDIDGITVGFDQRPDGVDDDGNVINNLRAFVKTDEYEFTFGARQPHEDNLSYIDMNVEELKAHAADDATNGFTVDVDLDGETKQVGIADILNLGEGKHENSALYQDFLDASA